MPLVTRHSVAQFLSKKFDRKNYQTQNKHEKANAIDPVHVADPFGFRLVWFSEIKVLCYLSPNPHTQPQIYSTHRNSERLF
jgi:hypothetical protein